MIKFLSIRLLLGILFLSSSSYGLTPYQINQLEQLARAIRSIYGAV